MKIMSIVCKQRTMYGQLYKTTRRTKRHQRTWQVKTWQNSRLLFQRFEQVRAKEFTYFAEREKRGMKSNLSQLTFVALVLGTITPIYTNNEYGINRYVLSVGLALTIVLANIGSKILKRRQYGNVMGYFYRGAYHCCWLSYLAALKAGQEMACRLVKVVFRNYLTTSVAVRGTRSYFFFKMRSHNSAE